MYLGTFFILCPECFCLTLRIILNHLIGRIQNILSRTVILLQTDHLCVREHSLKAQDILDIRASEFVDGLIIISHHTEVLIFGCQKTHELKLGQIGVLIFVHHDIAESLLIRVQDIRIALKQFHCLHNQIIKIQCIVLAKLCLVFFVDLDHRLFLIICPVIQLKLFRSDHLILRMGNLCHQGAFLINFRIDIQPFADILDDRLLVICVVYSKTIVESQAVDVTPQNPHTGGVKCGHPDALRAKAHNFVHTLSHLLRRFVGEGDRHNIPGVHPFLLNQVSNSVRQNPGFSGTRSCQNQQRPFCVADCLFLLRIQIFK